MTREITTQTDTASINKQPNQLPEKFNSEEGKQIDKKLKQRTIENKVYENAMKDFPIPKNVKNTQFSICPIKEYMKGVEEFSKETRPLTNVKKKEENFTRITDQRNAFDLQKNK
jgi:hypothetical protein